MKGARECVVPFAHMLRQVLAPVLRSLWPSGTSRSLPRPLQANPFAPQTRRAVHAAQAFVVIGDPGDRGRAQYQLAHQLTHEFEQRPFGCLIMLGDNVYDHGEPAYFEASLGQPYRFFQEQGVPVFAVLGNHDVQTAHGVLQLQYWGGLPRYYQVTLAHGAVAILALDTTLLCPGSYACYATSAARAWAQQQATRQLVWLAHRLRKSRALLNIVVGHYPLYSSGPHGLETDIQAHLRQILEPLLADPVHGAQLYLAGHEHLFEVTPPMRQGQWCRPDQGGVMHMISGAAGRLSQVELPHPSHPRWAAVAQHHYVRFEWVAWSRCLAYTVKDGHGAVIGYGTVPARATVLCPSWTASNQGARISGDVLEVRQTGPVLPNNP
jgi:tartrate-resistant acid phosphatase type 5